MIPRNSVRCTCMTCMFSIERCEAVAYSRNSLACTTIGTVVNLCACAGATEYHVYVVFFVSLYIIVSDSSIVRYHSIQTLLSSTQGDACFFSPPLVLINMIS